MIKINLVPQEILAKEAQKQRLAQVGLGAGLALAVVAGLSFMHFNTQRRLEAELKEAKAEAEKLKDAKAKLDAAKARQAAVVKRREVLQGLITSRRLYPIFMSDIVDILPRSVYLESLTTKNTAAEALDISLDAVAPRPEEISEWLRVLASTQTQTGLRGRFSDAVLGAGISLGDTGDRFSLKMKYALPKPGT